MSPISRRRPRAGAWVALLGIVCAGATPAAHGNDQQRVWIGLICGFFLAVGASWAMAASRFRDDTSVAMVSLCTLTVAGPVTAAMAYTYGIHEDEFSTAIFEPSLLAPVDVAVWAWACVRAAQRHSIRP